MQGTPESSFSELNKHSSLNFTDPGIIFGSSITLAELSKIIFGKLHPLFSIDCGVILIYDDQLSVIKEAYTSTFLSNTEQIQAEVANQPHQLNTIQKNIANFEFPVIRSKSEWLEEEGQNQKLINGEADYKFHCYIPLEIENKILGTLELHNNTREFSAECLAFCSSIADLITDIIFLQQRQALNQEPSKIHDKTARQQVSEITEATGLFGSAILADVNANLTVPEEADSLDDFFDKVAILFPAAYKKFKIQLEEIKAFKTQQQDESLYLTDEHTTVNNYPEIIGAGPKMNKVFTLMDQVAVTDSTVLITGETGTGKELIAKAIHSSSARKNNPIVSVNCAAIPENLIESELFGHEKGSFTGATDQRTGKFELADNGTLFLDEIGELPLDLQVKLLRALQEKEIERVGGKTTIKINVRIISATNRDLLTEVEQGRFRRDLYYRLHVFPINLPPLRERTDDIPLLAAYFLSKYGKQQTGFSQRAIKQMVNYNWPGNVREMEHLIERQVLLTNKPLIGEINIPTTAKTITDEAGAKQKIKTIEENERDHIFAVLQLCNGRISGEYGAAKLLGVPATTINSKIKKLGLNKKHF